VRWHLRHLLDQPVTQQAIGYREQGRAEEQPHETERENAAEHTEQHHHQRQIASSANQIGFEHVVHAADDEHPPDAEEDRHTVIALPGQPGNGWAPDQRRHHDEATGEGQQPEHQRSRHPGDEKTDVGQNRLSRGSADHPVDHSLHRPRNEFQIMIRSVTDQPVQQAMDECRQAWPIAIEEEHQHQAQRQFEHPAADARAAHQEPVGDLADVGPNAGDQRRALLVHGAPEIQQCIAYQRNLTQPGRRRR